MQSRYLTKSRFKLATECPTKLYYYGKQAEYKDNMQEDAFLAMLAEGGYQVGELAKLRYPNGIEINETNHAKAHAETLAYLQQENVVLFEPAILVDHFFIRIDVLIKKGNQFELIEVKAKSYDSRQPNIAGKRKSISASFLPYIEDAAFQTWVLQQAFPASKISTFLMMPDKAHAAMHDGINQMFKINGRDGVLTNIPQGVDIQSVSEQLLAKVCVNEFVSEVLGTPLHYPGGESFIPDIAKAWAEAYVNDKKIAPAIGKHCGSCQFNSSDGIKSGFHECWQAHNNWNATDFERGTVLDLWNYRKKQQLIDQGIYKLSQVSREDIGDFEDEAGVNGLTHPQRQWMQVNGLPPAYAADRHYFDKSYFQVAESHWSYPYHMIDFETSTVALPFYKGMRPYEPVAFQFSHHVIEADGTVKHANEFLNTEPGQFPNYAFARALKEALENDNGTVFMWSPHENTILEAIIAQLANDENKPDDSEALIAFLKSIVRGGERAMVDLCQLAEKAYFHPDTKGSNSIKQVLPAILKESSFLQETYSKPIYGAVNGMPSKNFGNHKEGFTWISKNPEGVIIEPYTRLKHYALEMLEGEAISKEGQASIIAEGGAAATAYARLQFEDIDEADRTKINAALLRYCELDTLAMVMIMQGWQTS